MGFIGRAVDVTQTPWQHKEEGAVLCGVYSGEHVLGLLRRHHPGLSFLIIPWRRIEGGADPPSSPPASHPSFVGLADSFAFNPHKMLGLRSRGQHSLFGIVAR